MQQAIQIFKPSDRFHYYIMNPPQKHFGKSKSMTYYTATVWVSGVREISNLILMIFKESFQDQYLQGIQVHDEKTVSTKCTPVLMISVTDPTLLQQN